MPDYNPYQPPQASLLHEQPNAHPELQGLGGWLILVGIGVVLSPIRVGLGTYATFSEMFQSGNFSAITTPGGINYIPNFMGLVIFELVANVVMFVAGIYLAILYFRKKRAFPKAFIIIMLFSLAILVADTLGVIFVMPNQELLRPHMLKGVIRLAIGAVIWIPYMMVSKRVKATFVN